MFPMKSRVAGYFQTISNCLSLMESRIPVPDGSVDVAYSNQLMEHLHPDDAVEQLAQIFRALRQGAAYICITPNRLCGPHDISRFFDSVPRGFHLREYSNSDLVWIFTSAGFGRFRVFLRYKLYKRVFSLLIPLWPVLKYEQLISLLPRKFMKALAYPLIGVYIVAYKV